MISIQSTIDLRFLQIRQTHLVWHLYDGIPDIFNKLDSLRDTQAKDVRRGQRAHGYFNTIKSASAQWPFAERSSAGTAGAGVSVETGWRVKSTEGVADRTAPAVVQTRLVRLLNYCK
jgi:hypothetical protein